jgi:hypothetical protein
MLPKMLPRPLFCPWLATLVGPFLCKTKAWPASSIVEEFIVSHFTLHHRWDFAKFARLRTALSLWENHS